MDWVGRYPRNLPDTRIRALTRLRSRLAQVIRAPAFGPTLIGVWALGMGFGIMRGDAPGEFPELMLYALVRLVFVAIPITMIAGLTIQFGDTSPDRPADPTRSDAP